jgi:hypothetical protein
MKKDEIALAEREDLVILSFVSELLKTIYDNSLSHE